MRVLRARRFTASLLGAVLTLLAGSLAVTVTADAAEPTLTGTWGDKCASISVTSADYPADYQVWVRWYADATRATPLIDGDTYAPINKTWTMAVDRNKVRGFSYRVVDANKNYVTPLKDAAASCTYVAQPYVVLAADDCDTLSFLVGNVSPSYPATVRVRDETGALVNEFATGKTVPLTGSLDVKTGHTYTAEIGYQGQQWYPKGYSDEVDLTADCPAPKRGVTIKKVDRADVPLAGMTFGGESCTRWDGATDWTCTPLPASGWTQMSTDTSTAVTDNVEMRAPKGDSCSVPSTDANASDHKLRLWEVTAPAGYAKISGELSLCLTRDGWSVTDNTAGGAVTTSVDGLNLVVTFRDAKLTPTPTPLVVTQQTIAPTPSASPSTTSVTAAGGSSTPQASPTSTVAPASGAPSTGPSTGAGAGAGQISLATPGDSRIVKCGPNNDRIKLDRGPSYTTNVSGWRNNKLTVTHVSTSSKAVFKGGKATVKKIFVDKNTPCAASLRTFQVDRYTWSSADLSALVQRLPVDGKLDYREDRALWGNSAWEFVSVSLPASASGRELFDAINAKTSPRVGDLTSTTRSFEAGLHGSVTYAWELGPTATPTHPWGPRHNVPQAYLGFGR